MTMKSLVIDALRSNHQARGNTMTQADKNQLTRTFGSFADQFGGVNSLIGRVAYITVERDPFGHFTMTDTSEQASAPVDTPSRYEVVVSNLLNDKYLSRSEVAHILAEVAPNWAVVDGNRKIRYFVKGAIPQSRIRDVRAASLAGLGDIERTNGERYKANDVWLYLARYQAFLNNRSAIYREAMGIAKGSDARDVLSKPGRPIEPFLESLKNRQTPAVPADLLTLTLPTGFTASTRTWGIELEHVDMAGINVPADDWDAKGDGSLRGAEGVGGDRCERCRNANSSRNNNAAQTLNFRDGDRYRFGCTCEDCRNNIIAEFVNVGDIQADPNHEGRWLFRTVEALAAERGGAVAEPAPEPELPATWPCYCTGQTREFVSPILRTVNDANLKALADQLVNRKTNQSAGVHVHVGASDLNLKAQAELIRNWALIDAIITPLYQRTERQYCKDHSIKDVATAHKLASPRAKTTSGSWESHFNRDRYKTVNLQALSAHNTVEFRAMGPVYDYEYLVRWATFVREMVNVAASGTPAKVWQSAKTFADVLAILNKYGKEIGK